MKREFNNRLFYNRKQAQTYEKDNSISVGDWYYLDMRKVVRFLTVISLLIIPQWVVAQSISVSSFKLLGNDLTANTTGTMERDQNGETAALIKVVTSEQGFVFDGGMVGIVKTKQGVGEVWVYVPHGIKKITVQHPQLGVLRDYYFPTTIEKAKTYEMILTTGRVETIVTHSVNKQFVIFNIEPSNAIVELDGEVLTVDGEGYAEKGLPFGTYNYRVSCANYHTEAGLVTLNAQNKAEVNVTLRPNFGWIRFEGNKDFHNAHIYIDNERVGQLPLTTEGMKSGVYSVKIVKSMYKTYERQVKISDNETTNLNVVLIPNFANVTLKTDAASEIWVDGKLKGKGTWTGPMEIGEYKVEVKKEAHRTRSEIVNITELNTRILNLSSPTPIYTNVEITSTPSRATVIIDGVEVGQTPIIKENVLVGSHRITLKKEGYETLEKIMTLQENAENTLTARLIEKVDNVAQSVVNDNKTSNSAEEEIYQVVETQPEFPGGMAELMRFLQRNIIYPPECLADSIQGRVVVQFVVDSDGSVVEPRVVTPVKPYLDQEALRVISIMPKWKPGTQKGKAVRVRYTLPITFRLSSENDKK